MGWGGGMYDQFHPQFCNQILSSEYRDNTETLIFICKKLLELRKIGPHQLLSNIHVLKFTVMCMS